MAWVFSTVITKTSSHQNFQIHVQANHRKARSRHWFRRSTAAHGVWKTEEAENYNFWTLRGKWYIVLTSDVVANARKNPSLTNDSPSDSSTTSIYSSFWIYWPPQMVSILFLKLVSFHNVCIVQGSPLPFSSKFHETYLGQLSQFKPILAHCNCLRPNFYNF